MRSRIETVHHQNGELQRFQVVEGFDWESVDFIFPGFDKKAIAEIARLYRTNIIPRDPSVVAALVFFHVPDDMNIPFPKDTKQGTIFSNIVACSVYLNEQVEKGAVRWNGKLVVDDEVCAAFLKKLEEEGLSETVQGSGTAIRFIPVNQKMGFLSKSPSTSCIVNSHFFLMDPTDLDSPYCILGTPYGLALKDGVVLQPPLNHREVLLVNEQGITKVTHVELTALTVVIDGISYTHGQNCTFHFRPEERQTPKHDGMDVVIVENKVIALKSGGATRIPMAGFILSLDQPIQVQDTQVTFQGLEKYRFGIQVGPAMVEDSVMVNSLKCPFYDMKKDPVPFPSTVYPLPYDSARAARIAIGSNKEHEAVLIWAEGAGKLVYDPKNDSTGCSLLELAQFTKSEGFTDIVNLDGGGSSQILYDGTRQLKIADRYKETNKVAERPVPVGLVIR